MLNCINYLAVLLPLVTTVQGFFNSVPVIGSNGKNTIPDQKILELAKDYILNKNGFYAPVDADALAEDFVFRGVIIGPLNKKDYCTTMKKLGIAEAFDLSPNFFGFCVDPDIPNTARFYVRYTGKQVANWKIQGTPFNVPPKDDAIVGPTEPFSVRFDDQGKVKLFTIGAPMLVGNPNPHTTGKYGAVLGLFSHVGLGFFVDYNKIVTSTTNPMDGILPEEISPPLTASKPENTPSWFQDF